ncbi:MAG: DUF938 domain-containing protein [Deltaproteobacteria bacterium]|nr:DUF938 domain-containing protein [Deltaproteobacteria bacterium]
MKRTAPSALRNREPIALALQQLFSPQHTHGALLEIASGTGQHAAHLAEHFGALSIQPTDADPANVHDIDAWTEPHRSRVKPAVVLDVHSHPWPLAHADVVLCINMIHIAPWSACEALIKGSAHILAPGGLLALYGPFTRDGEHTAPSNVTFDQWLKDKDPAYGVRAIEAVTALASAQGLSRVEPIEMPANNFVLGFYKR